LDDITVATWFSEGFLKTNFYMFWRTMFAFQNWHSVLEMKLSSLPAQWLRGPPMVTATRFRN
ncbi:oleate hydratase, partial [uncultured Thiodictyon sp.]